MNYTDMTRMIKREMVPALGCTGPTAYALAAARCKPLLTAYPEQINIYVCPSQLKIGFGVTTPGAAEPGIGMAAAIGVLGGDYTRGFGVLETASAENAEEALALVRDGKTKVLCDWAQDIGIYVRVEVQTKNETASATVAGMYDKIVEVTKDGEKLFSCEIPAKAVDDSETDLTPDLIQAYIAQVSPDVLAFLLDGYHMNVKLAEDGLKEKFGLESGRSYLQVSQNTSAEELFADPLQYLPQEPYARTRILVAAASDARMGGSTLPAMAAMGDGNQGITALIPVGLEAERLHATREKTILALAVSCLFTFYIKIHIGRTAAFCLCGIAAAVGAAAGISYLRSEDWGKVRASAKNVIATTAGMLCDGAKNGCALKMASASAAAIQSADLACYGMEVGSFDGIAAKTLEETVSNLAYVANASKKVLDKSIVDLITEK